MERLKKWNKNLNIMIGSFIGAFIGYSIYIYIDCRNRPGYYEMQSAPWYTSILVCGVGVSIFIIFAVIIKILLKKKTK